MKNKMLIIFCLISVLILSGCGASQDIMTPPSSIKTVDDVLNEKEIVIENTNESANQEQSEINEKIDVDLTTLSSTMVYSEVFNIMQNPSEYIGKAIKMTGTFVKYTNQDGSLFYPACVIADATACCSQGIEFVTSDDKYPDEGIDITVIGIFNSYIDESDGQMYFHLENAKISN